MSARDHSHEVDNDILNAQPRAAKLEDSPEGSNQGSPFRRA